MAQNEFSRLMGESFAPAADLMGDDLTLNGFPCRGVASGMTRTSAAAPAGGGRLVQVSGFITVSRVAWFDSGAKQGAEIVHPSLGRLKVVNTPNESAATIRLEVAGRAQS